MSDMNKYFPSRFLRGADLEEPVRLTIQKVGEEEMGRPGEEETKLVVSWSEDAKPLVLNKTNFKSIMKVSGSGFVKDWAGTVVELYTIHGEWFGEEQDAIRIRAPSKATAEAGKKPAKQSAINKTFEKVQGQEDEPGSEDVEEEEEEESAEEAYQKIRREADDHPLEYVDEDLLLEEAREQDLGYVEELCEEEEEESSENPAADVLAALDEAKSQFADLRKEVGQLAEQILASSERLVINRTESPDSLTIGTPTTGQAKVYGDLNKPEEIEAKLKKALEILGKASKGGLNGKE